MYTQHQIARLTQPGRYQVAETLFLNVAKGGSRSWIQRINENGKRKEFGLGGFPGVTIQEAKEKAILNRNKTRTGESLQNNAPTFEQATLDTIEEKRGSEKQRGSWKNEDASVKQWLSSMKQHAFPLIGHRKVTDLIGADFYMCLKPLWSDSPAMAQVMRKRFSMVMKWVCGQGHRPDNPVQTLTMPKQSTNHFKALHHDQVNQAIQTIQASTRAHAMTKLLLQFIILTGCRPGEGIHASWDEIDFETKTWTRPPEKMKAEKEHRIPLSDQAISILNSASTMAQNGSESIFSSERGTMDTGTLSKALKRLNIDCVAHGFRSSFRCWGSENGVAMDVLEKCLAHKPDKVVGAYDRTDVLDIRREIMQQWGAYLAA